MRTDNTLIVVGDDGSSSASAAVEWAALHASRTGSRLRLVHVVHVPVMAGLGWQVDASMEAGRLLNAMKGASEELARRRGHWALEEHPDLDLESIVVLGDPRDTLVREAESAGLLVVGSRGHGHLQNLLLGSVSTYVARHSACPTVVVKQPGEAGHGVLLVVHAGDDPSAFAFAAPYAASHRLPLTVLRESGGTRAQGRAIETWQAVDEEIAAFRLRHPDLDVRFAESERVDVEQVTESGRAHELVVVERRPHGRPLLEPTVAVVEHGTCPVAVVPGHPVTPSGRAG